MFMKHFYIAVQYFDITNRLIAGAISRFICKLTEVMENNCFTQALQGKLFNTNKMKLMIVYFIKSTKQSG